jgi:hypothetical protein
LIHERTEYKEWLNYGRVKNEISGFLWGYGWLRRNVYLDYEKIVPGVCLERKDFIGNVVGACYEKSL